MDTKGNENSSGIVNQGFTIDFSSEEETSESGVDIVEHPYSKISSSKNSNAILKSLDSDTWRRSELLGNSGKNESYEKKVDSESHGRSHQQDLASPAVIIKKNTSSTDQKDEKTENVQSSYPANSCLTMFNVKADVSVQCAQNGKVAQNFGEIRNTTVDNSLCKEIHPISKEYFRSVHLSPADFVKSASGGLPFHSNNNKERRYVIGNQPNSIEESDNFCDNCRIKVFENYETVFKYLIERPLFCFSMWAMFYIFWGNEALPGGTLFALTMLEITALLLGYLSESLQLPGLIGMTAAGLLLKNVPYFDVAKDLDRNLSSALRGTSIVILLTRGGLSVNPANIVKFKNIVPSLVIGSCVLEAAAATAAVYFIIGFPLEWAALMGCIMSAMSSVAVVPYLTSTENYLAVKAEPYILSPNHHRVLATAKTACGLDAILAICMAEVALGFIFAEGNVGNGIMMGVVEILIGGAFGIVWGCLAGTLLDKTSSNEKRVLTVFASGVMSLIGLTKIGYPRGGPLATFSGSLVVNTLWKRNNLGENNHNQLNESFTMIWFVFQPLLFGIIGTRTDFATVNWNVVTKGLICLAISLLVRFIASFCMTSWGNLLIKERIYLGLAWFPKGTVQAALGPVALDTALGLEGLKSPIHYKNLGYQVMNISAVTVVAAATIGSLLLRYVGPRLLCQKK